MSNPGWYPQPDGLEKYWDGQNWIAMRVPVVGVPTTEGSSDSRPTRPGLQRRFILPSAALGVALAVIVLVSTLNPGTSGAVVESAATQTAVTTSTPVSTAEATSEPSANPAQTVIPAPAVSVAPEPTPSSSSPGSVQQIPPPVQELPASAEPTVICPSQGLTIEPGPVSLTATQLGIEGSNHIASGGTVTNRSSAVIDLWDVAPELESLDGSGNVLTQTWGTKFVYSAPAGEPKDLKFTLAPGARVLYAVDQDIAMPDFKKHVSWYTVTNSMTWGWTASQFQGTCTNPSMKVLQ